MGVHVKFGQGQPAQRKEDKRFITGAGRYTDDIALTDQAQMAILRSPHAHARIESLDLAAARAAPGVLAVLTIADLDELGVKPIRSSVTVPNRDGAAFRNTDRPILAREHVRMVGEPIVAVIAESLGEARDACDLVEITFAELPAIATLAAARAPEAPQLWPQAPGNVAVDWEMGDAEATAAAFAADAQSGDRCAAGAAHRPGRL